MDGLYVISASREASASLAGTGRMRDPLHLYWALFAGAVVFFALDKAFNTQLGPLATMVAILGSSTCGVSWLLTHALFRPSTSRAQWPLFVALALFGMAAIIELGPNTVIPGSLAETFMNMTHKARSLLSSTVLVVAFFEPLRGYSSDLTMPEKRFRLSFITGYGALVAISVLLIDSVRGLPVMWEDAVKIVCALLALIAAAFAVGFRTASPLSKPVLSKKTTPLPDSEYLQQRIRQRLEKSEIYKTPDLKVADLAHMVGEPEHRVSQCISQMGFQNFSRLINAYRIDHAKRMLADPAFDSWSILSVAMDCGFGSIGPFNRGFKDAVGMTPKQYRSAVRSVH